MSEAGNTAYITGGASGIGRAAATMLVGRGAKVFIADRDNKGAESVAAELNNKTGQEHRVAWAHQLDVVDWESQRRAFEAALHVLGGRIDYVMPIAGIGERPWTPNGQDTTAGFIKPELTVIDVDTIGVLYTASLAIQQFRQQGPSKHGFRGKLVCVSSVCGFYCIPTLPIYTAAKHSIVGFVRSFGKYLLEEQITMNAVCPNVVRTNFSADSFYKKVEEKQLFTPMESVVRAFKAMLRSSDASGELFEVGPNGGYHLKPPVPWMDAESKECLEMTYDQARVFHQPQK